MSSYRMTLLLLLTSFLACADQPENEATTAGVLTPNAETYTPPAEGTSSLIRNLNVRRDERGGVVVTAEALLPRRTKVWIEIFRSRSRKAKDLVAHTETHVGFNGVVAGGPFDIPNSGKYDIAISSHFNGAWQKPEILRIVGDSGKHLPKSALEPTDPEFPTAGGHLSYIESVSIPAPPPSARAIHAVKRSKLYVKGKGQAVDSIEEILKFLNKPGVEFHPGEWTATEIANGKWKVTLAHRWGKEAKLANWEYDSRSGKVKYLDAEAKMLSWIPAE